MAFRRFAPYFNAGSPERQAEIELCGNLSWPTFDQISLIGDDPITGERPKFSTILDRASRESSEGDIVFVCNSDIAVTYSDLCRIESEIQINQVYCLTRWEVSSTKGIHLWDVEYSQDAWVFRGPPKENIGGDYWFGVPGCDNRFAHELDAAGYEVLNPSRDIRTYHIHASNKRTATNTEAHRVPPPYLYIAPHHLGETPTINRAATYEQRKGVIARRKMGAR